MTGDARSAANECPKYGGAICKDEAGALCECYPGRQSKQDARSAASVTDEAKRLLAGLTPEQRALLDRCTCDLARPYWHSFHREGCPLAR